MTETLRERIEKGEFENKAPAVTNAAPYSEILLKDEEYLRLCEEKKQLSSRLEDIRKEKISICNLIHSVRCGEVAGRIECFREALETEFGTSNHPKRDQLWVRAWDRGHNFGWTEILVVYEDLVDLVL